MVSLEAFEEAGHHLAQCEQCSHAGFPGPPLKSHIKNVQSTSVTVRTANRPATEEKRWQSSRQRLGSRRDALLSPNAMMACNAKEVLIKNHMGCHGHDKNFLVGQLKH